MGDGGASAGVPGWFKGLVIAAVVGLVGSLGALFVVGSMGNEGAQERRAPVAGGGARFEREEEADRSPLEPDAGLESLRIGSFELVDQDGNAVDESVLDGRVSVLAFIFTHCPFACPQMTERMMQVREAVDSEGVQFVSMSIDPAHDTPSRLREYAAEKGIDTEGWVLLTGEPGAVSGIVQEQLGFLLEEDDRTRVDLDAGGSMANIVHPTRLLLVGPDRRVMGLYSSGDPGVVEPMAERAGLLAEAARAGGD